MKTEQMGDNPIVSIITPVYNAEKYLAECIESIIAQTYENWEYVVVNNFSTDRSLEIALRYGKREKRIRVHNNDKFLALMQNWNHAISQISPNSKYCKVVHADDWIFPDCLEKMVNLAEKHPSVGIIGAYRLDEDTVNLDGLPYPSTVIPGHEICRRSLLGGPYVFGSPSSLLYRSDLIRTHQPLYNETNIHADKETCYKLLQKSDFGFVHQVLTFTRRHNETETTHSKLYNTYRIGKFFILKKYGPVFLSKSEYDKRFKIMRIDYHRHLVLSLFELKSRDYFAFHLKELKKLGVRINPARLLFALIRELMNPLNVIIKIRSGLIRKLSTARIK